ncbi:single-stranded DNA-binding protein [Streptomyces albidoflavus]|uniref:single-stranded DNA-binding protein n=1 Tax=Streptomyces albidoflavus TaxID=1886 RepID=UPI00188BF65C|nr:single-stranded DNA-binding protein [Streptomyces albidoflavus]MBF4138236.1 single-stranded DNA-binding protein [Streptomyces albidoflavus]
MPYPASIQIVGDVQGSVESRFTDSGIVVTRFRLASSPPRWDQAQGWVPGPPLHYVCTAWRDLARNAAESLVEGTSVLVFGRITEVREDTQWLSVDELGVSLRARIAYTEEALPGPAAAAPVKSAPATPPRPAPRPPAPGAAPEPAEARVLHNVAGYNAAGWGPADICPRPVDFRPAPNHL